MNNKILVEVRRQKKLMGLISESDILLENLSGNVMIELLQKILSISKYDAKFRNIFNILKNTEGFREADKIYGTFSTSARMVDFDQFKSKISGLVSLLRTSRATVKPELIEAYKKIFDDFIEIIFTNNQFRDLRNDIFNKYYDSSPDTVKNSIDRLIQIAKEGKTKEFNDAINILSRSVDLRILNYTKKYFPVQPVTGGFWRGLGKSIISELSYFWNKFWVKRNIDTLFKQYNDIVDKLSEDIAANKIENFNLYISNLDKLSKQISEIKINPTDLTNYWNQFKKDLPDNLKDLFEKPDGTLDYGQFESWITYFNTNAAIREKIKPHGFVTRIDALKRILTNKESGISGTVQELSGYKTRMKRVGNFLLKMDARTANETALNKKILSGEFKGYTYGEYIKSLFFYSAFISTLIKTMLDVAERSFPEYDIWFGDKTKFEDPNLPETKFSKALFIKAIIENFNDNFSIFTLTKGKTDIYEFLIQCAKSISPGAYTSARIILHYVKMGGKAPISNEEIKQLQQNIEIGVDTTNNVVMDSVKRSNQFTSEEIEAINRITNEFAESVDTLTNN